MIKIQNKQLCTGCLTCASVCPKGCISALPDEKGFLYPKVDENLCVNCGLCEKACPVTNLKENYCEKFVFAAKNKNDDLRKTESSGGVFGCIADEVLNKNGVVFGAAFLGDFKSVKHIAVDNKADIEKLYGSKYLQSDIADSFKLAEKYLKNDKYVLFSGTSCQIAGLKAFLKRDYEKLITVDVVCHGVPSPKIWRDYCLKQEEKEKSQITNVVFRDKSSGWSKYSVNVEFSNGKKLCELASKNAYMQGFLSNVYLRDSCYACKFKQNNVLSDITLGDFWGVQNVLPDFYDEKGVSAVIINTLKGRDVFDGVKEKLEVTAVSYESVEKGNPSLVKAVAMPDKTDKFWRDYNNKGFEKALNGCLKTSFLRRAYRYIRRLLKKGKK